jgi:hypothetical protein
MNWTHLCTTERELSHFHLPSIAINGYVGQPDGDWGMGGPDAFGASQGGNSDEELLDVLNGASQLDASHAGGELCNMLDRLADWPLL